MEQLLKAGIERVILGTAAVEDPKLIEEACRKFGESIIIGIDVLSTPILVAMAPLPNQILPLSPSWLIASVYLSSPLEAFHR